ncbi:MAG TPA: vWA domain-containing protein, partial [Polyangiaceae bacterium]|nr:vWA domain-containing protein [Polyangiaceae bacterium]
MAGRASPGTRWAGQVALVACTAACGGSVMGDPAGRTGAGGDEPSAPTTDGGSGVGGSGGDVEYLPCTGGETSGGCIPETLTASAFGDGAVSLTEAEYDETWKSMCAEKRVVLPGTPASLMIVLDASATMDAAANGTGEASKWAVTRDALKAMLASLPDSAAVGLLGYPNRVVSGVPGGHEECVALDAMVPVQALGSGDWRAELDDGLDAIQTEACTPTHDAYVAAVDAYPAASSPTSERFVLLITDGVPTLSLGCAPGECGVGDGYEQAVIDEIEWTRTALGIQTLVLGLPGSEEAYETLDNRWWLSMAAEAGGTPALNCSHDEVPYCHLDTVA